MSAVKPVRTCFNNPNDPSQAYFIKNYEFVIIHWTPGKVADTIVHGPASLDYWPALRDAGISSIDGVLLYPNNKNRAYIFSGGLYVNIGIDTSGDITVISGPRPIHGSWKTLTDAGFITIDAVVPVPGETNEAFFFSGTRYVRVYYVPGSSEKHIVYGPAENYDGWPGLQQAQFPTIDCILPNPTAEDQAYFFSGNRYCQLKITVGAENHVLRIHVRLERNSGLLFTRPGSIELLNNQ